MITDPSALQVRCLDLFTRQRRGALTAIKRDGRPHLSTVVYAFDPARQLVRVSITDDRIKTRILRRDPRAGLYVSSSDYLAWAVLEGTADLTPVAESPQDATVDELIDVYRSIAGEHPDWDEYRQAMVAERRLVARIEASHVYGQA
jgi:PPOX class probable F420-dependent enzyme